MEQVPLPLTGIRRDRQQCIAKALFHPSLGELLLHNHVTAPGGVAASPSMSTHSSSNAPSHCLPRATLGWA